jgi:fucose permease
VGLAPFLVSLNKDMHCKGTWTLGGESDFHIAFIITACVTGGIAIAPLLLKSPRPPVETESEKDAAQSAAAEAKAGGFFAKPGVLWGLFFVYKGVYVMTENSLGAWIAAFAELSCLVSAVDAPKLGTLFFWCYTATRMVSAAASTRISSTVILAVCYIGAIAGFILVTLSSAGEGSATILWVGTCVLGIFVGPIFPSGLSLFAEWGCPPSGKVIGLMWAISFICDIVGQQIMGQHFKACAYDRFGPTLVIEIVMAASILCVIRVCALPAVGKAPGSGAAGQVQEAQA